MELRCIQCGQETSIKGSFVINGSVELAAFAFLIVPADKVERPRSFDKCLCGKECAGAWFSEQLDGLRRLETAAKTGSFFKGDHVLSACPPGATTEVTKICPGCGSVMPANEGTVCIDCQEAGRVA